MGHQNVVDNFGQSRQELLQLLCSLTPITHNKLSWYGVPNPVIRRTLFEVASSG
jgi:hypothetical protein